MVWQVVRRLHVIRSATPINQITIMIVAVEVRYDQIRFAQETCFSFGSHSLCFETCNTLAYAPMIFTRVALTHANIHATAMLRNSRYRVNLVVHPCSNTASCKASSETEARGAHRKVRDGEPQQGDQLRNDRNESKDSAV